MNLPGRLRPFNECAASANDRGPKKPAQSRAPAVARPVSHAETRIAPCFFIYAIKESRLRVNCSAGDSSRPVKLPLRGWFAAASPGRNSPRNPEGDRHPHRKDCMGIAGNGSGWLLGWYARPRYRRDFCLQRRRAVHGGRYHDWQSVMAVPDKRRVQGLADDLHVRRDAICGDRCGPEYPGIRAD